MADMELFLADHQQLSRRFFLGLGIVCLGSGRLQADELKEAIAKLEPLFTEPEKFRDVSRGTPKPHSLPVEKLAEVGLTRETWRLEVLADPDHPTKLRTPMTVEKGTALDFASLLRLGETVGTRFVKVMTCLNIGCPLGTGVWEGVPLREVIWKTQPVENWRRVIYHGYHNDDPKQIFRSSLPASRVLEDPFDLPPVILCTKLNGQWLSPVRGGPVRMVVPEAYGFKSIKWLKTVQLSNLASANDTYIDGNNDVDSPLKSFAATLGLSKEHPAGRPLPVTGYAQVGIAGVRKVQVWICPKGAEPPDDPNFLQGDWRDATILEPPADRDWGGGLPDEQIPLPTLGFESNRRPQRWPMRLGKIHWAILWPGLPTGEYTLRSRTIDDKGQAQPMPRPFRKSGHAAIEAVNLTIT